MKLSVETEVLSKKLGSDEAALRAIAAAGFDAFDYSYYYNQAAFGDDYREYMQSLKRLAEELGITCNQAHAPFMNVDKAPDEFGFSDEMTTENRAFRRLVQSIEGAAILGAKNIVVHAIKNKRPEHVDFYEFNRRFYKSLIPYCETFGICVSVENLFMSQTDGLHPVLGDPAEHQAFVQSIGSPWINICVDVGHSGITGYPPQEVLRAMSPALLKALHIQDTDGVHDQHMLPYLGSFDWEAIAGALGENGYTGDFTLEIVGYLGKQPPENIPAALAFAARTGRMLINKIESYKK